MTKTPSSFAKQTFFPTHVFKMVVDDAEALNRQLLKTIYAERDKDRKGISRSNFTGLGGWHSKNFLHQAPEYADLVEWISIASRKLSSELGYAKGHKLKIGTMWSIINPPGSSNRSHIHPGCLWSGVYYIQAPKGSGDIEFTDSRTAHMMNQPKFIPNTKRKKECWTKVKFAPEAGKMLIFPSWLYHSVEPNMSKETGDEGNRIIISFNLNQRKA